MKKKNRRARTSTAIVEMAARFPNQNEADDVDQAAGVNFPPELIYDILSRLPAKTVGRFRCVSKHWQTLLSDPKFLKIQFSRHNHQTKVILQQDFAFLSVEFRKNGSNSSDPVGIFETLKFEPTNIRYTMRGSCNGLILLYDYKKLELSIANPITHESRQLPPFPKCIRAHFCKFGFGYCSNDDEYTVVVISDHTRSSRVYMLKRNMWKRVGRSPHGIALNCATFVNGAIHWLYTSDSDHVKIYAFDLAGERFREVEQPEGLKKDVAFVVDVLDGCLCLIVFRKNLSNDMWVMKEYGVRESWTKYVACSSQDYRYIQPYFFWNGDESIVAVGERKFVRCCLKQETSWFIPVIGEGCPELFYEHVWTFVDSLFSPNSSNAVEGPSQVQV